MGLGFIGTSTQIFAERLLGPAHRPSICWAWTDSPDGQFLLSTPPADQGDSEGDDLHRHRVGESPSSSPLNGPSSVPASQDLSALVLGRAKPGLCSHSLT